MIVTLIVLLGISTQSEDVVQFTLNETIDIPAGLPVSIIEQVDVDKYGNILITDSSSASAILYLNSGQFVKKLDSRECHPGFSHQPVRTYFTGNEIWMMHRHFQVFRFTLQGECIGAVDKVFFTPDIFGGDVTTTLAGLRPKYNNYSEPVLELYSDNLDTTGRIELSSHFIAPNMSFRFQGGGIVTQNSLIFLSASSSPAIYEVNDENVTVHLPDISGVSYSVNDDISLDNGDLMGSLLAETERYRRRNTIVRNLFALNDEYLVLNVISPRSNKEELIFFDLIKRSFPDVIHSLDEPSFVHHISDNKAYKVSEDLNRDDVDWVINIYDIALLFTD